MGLSLASFRSQQPQEAILYCKKALEIDSSFTSAYNIQLGQVYDSLGQFKEAIVCYQEAIKIDPNNATVYAYLGAAYYGLGQFQESKENLLTARKLFQNRKDNPKVLMFVEELLKRLSNLN